MTFGKYGLAALALAFSMALLGPGEAHAQGFNFGFGGGNNNSGGFGMSFGNNGIRFNFGGGQGSTPRALPYNNPGTNWGTGGWKSNGYSNPGSNWTSGGSWQNNNSWSGNSGNWNNNYYTPSRPNYVRSNSYDYDTYRPSQSTNVRRGNSNDVVDANGSITLINPASTGTPVHFTCGGKSWILEPGEHKTITGYSRCVVNFHCGGNYGRKEYTLASGKAYRFYGATNGWDLKTHTY